MILKSYYKNGFSVTLSLSIDWEKNKIDVEVITTGGAIGGDIVYPAAEFDRAVSQYNVWLKEAQKQAAIKEAKKMRISPKMN